MHVVDDQRQLGDGGQAHDLGLQRDAGARGGGHRLLARVGATDRGADAGDLVLALQHAAAVLPDLLGQDLHHLGGRGDGVAGEELDAREQGARGAHVVAVAQEHLGVLAGDDLQRAGHLQRPRLGELDAGVERALVGLQQPFALAAELLLEAPHDGVVRHAEPARQQAQHDGGLGLVGAGVLLGQLAHGHRHDLGGDDAALGEGLRRGPGLLLVDEDGGGPQRQLGAELEEVVPVEGDRHVQHAARVEDRLGAHAHPARRLAAADLGTETLGHDGVVALCRGRLEERFACADDAVAARASHADDEFVHHVGALPCNSWTDLRSGCARGRTTNFWLYTTQRRAILKQNINFVYLYGKIAQINSHVSRIFLFTNNLQLSAENLKPSKALQMFLPEVGVSFEQIII